MSTKYIPRRWSTPILNNKQYHKNVTINCHFLVKAPLSLSLSLFGYQSRKQWKQCLRLEKSIVFRTCFANFTINPVDSVHLQPMYSFKEKGKKKKSLKILIKWPKEENDISVKFPPSLDYVQGCSPRLSEGEGLASSFISHNENYTYFQRGFYPPSLKCSINTN